MNRRNFRIGKNISKGKNYRLLFIGIFLALILAVAVPVYYFRAPIIPRSISKQVTFPIFYPKPSSRLTYEKGSFKYSKSLGQISYIVDYQSQSITFAEQSSPDSFTANPTFYTSFVEKLNGYATFQSIDGRVDLTDPSQVNAETAVMNANGTLLFAKSNGNISQNNWKLLFNTFDYTQP